MKKLFVVFSHANREFGYRGGKVVTKEVATGRPMELPKAFDPRHWGWAQVVETRIDPSHKGAPRFFQEDWQTDRIVRVVGGTENVNKNNKAVTSPPTQSPAC